MGLVCGCRRNGLRGVLLTARDSGWDLCCGMNGEVKKNSPRSLRHLAMNHLVNRREGIPQLT